MFYIEEYFECMSVVVVFNFISYNGLKGELEQIYLYFFNILKFKKSFVLMFKSKESI